MGKEEYCRICRMIFEDQVRIMEEREAADLLIKAVPISEREFEAQVSYEIEKRVLGCMMKVVPMPEDRTRSCFESFRADRKIPHCREVDLLARRILPGEKI